jgi:hypothetical protein
VKVKKEKVVEGYKEKEKKKVKIVISGKRK